MIKDKAYAKINVALDITGLKDNNHLLNMVMAPVDLYDDISLINSEYYNLISNVDLPENNTIYKAIEVLREEVGFKDNFTVMLNKRIPSEAGLGGGSSDAATVLKMINRYLKLKLPTTKLMELGLKIGSDVPFFIKCEPSIVKGVGEKIETFKMEKDIFALLVKPSKGVSTKSAYKMYDEIGGNHPDIDRCAKAFSSGDLDTLSKYIGNSLEASAFRLNLHIEPIKKELENLGYKACLMSGSGSCVFGLSDKMVNLLEHMIYLEQKYPFVKVVKIISK